MLIRASGREELGSLDRPGTIGTLGDRDIAKLPCQDLRTIDDLWFKYSNGRFGFTAQAEIVQEISEWQSPDVWTEFCLRVGWADKKLRYILHSPVGHLPTPPLHFVSGDGDATDYNNNIEHVNWWNIATILIRFRECKE